MQRFRLFTFLIISASLFCLPSFRATAQSATPTPKTIKPGIHSPAAGSAVRGSVPIVGLTDVEGFTSSEILFSYQVNPTDTWFLIHQSQEPSLLDTPYVWDTSQISDGDYQIKLTINLNDGKQQIYRVKNIRVRNYTLIETDTPLPPTRTATSTPATAPSATVTSIPTATVLPLTSTPIPPNLAQISKQTVLTSIGKGALISLGIFILIGIYRRIYALTRKRYKDDY